MKYAVSNESVGMRVSSVSKRDESGWSRYQVRNRLDIQQNWTGKFEYICLLLNN